MGKTRSTGNLVDYVLVDASGLVTIPNGILNNLNRKTASYTLVLTDISKVIEMNVATANTITIPLNSSVAFPIGTEINIMQYGAGETSFVATGGVTIRSNGGALKISTQYSGASLVKIGTDEWYLIGNIKL